jgi:phosphatidylglycerophosphate synthase
MLDASLRKLALPPFAAIAARISGRPAGEIVLLASAFASGLGAFVCIAVHRPLAGLGLLVLKQLLEGVAGPLARIKGQSNLAAYLGEVFDFLVRAAIPLAFAIADTPRALAAAFLIVGFVGAGTARVAFEAFTDDSGPSPRSMPGRTAESATVYGSFAIACLDPAWFSVVAYALGVLCFVLAGARVASAIERLK